MIDQSGVVAVLVAIKNDDGNDDFITSIVCDEETFDWVWDEIERCKLQNVSSSEPVPPGLLAKIRTCKRIPFIRRTPRTEHIFAALGITLTDRFCGIEQGGTEIPFDLEH
jgi:hypothetical protein